MNRLLFTKMLIFFTIVVNAQSQLFDMIDKKDDKTGYFAVTDSAGNKSYFSIDEHDINATYYEKDRTYKLQAPRPEKKYNDVLGCQLKGAEYTVFFSNSWHTDLASVTFNFITNKIEQHIIPLNLNKESYCSSFTYKNKLYFITRLKDATGIRFFTFLQGEQFTTKTITFKGIDTGLTSFYAAFGPSNVAQIGIEVSDELNIARHKTKFIVFDDNLYISLDYLDHITSMIQINLNSFENTVSVYEQETDMCGNYSTSSNSFIYKDKLFQFTSCTSGINLRIRNIKDGKILKQYTATKDEEITFKNSAIIQKSSGLFEREKELNSKQFIRKTLNSFSFVSISEKDNKTLLVTLGGFKENSYAAPMGPGGSGGTAYHSSETLVYFNTILSRDTFDHINER